MNNVEKVAGMIMIQCKNSRNFECPYLKTCPHEDKEICQWQIDIAQQILSSLSADLEGLKPEIRDWLYEFGAWWGNEEFVSFNDINFKVVNLLAKLAPYIEQAKRETAREILGELDPLFNANPDIDSSEIAVEIIYQKIKSLKSKYGV